MILRLGGSEGAWVTFGKTGLVTFEVSGDVEKSQEGIIA